MDITNIKCSGNIISVSRDINNAKGKVTLNDIKCIVNDINYNKDSGLLECNISIVNNKNNIILTRDLCININNTKTTSNNIITSDILNYLNKELEKNLSINEIGVVLLDLNISLFDFERWLSKLKVSSAGVLLSTLTHMLITVKSGDIKPLYLGIFLGKYGYLPMITGFILIACFILCIKNTLIPWIDKSYHKNFKLNYNEGYVINPNGDIINNNMIT